MNETTRTVARRWFEEVWSQRRVACIHELLAPDAPGHMEGQEIKGPADFARVHEFMLAVMPDLAITIEDIVADGDDAVVRWHFQGTHTGTAEGLQPTNRTFACRGMTWFKIRDGKIVEGWDCWNHAALMRTLMAAS